MAALMIEDHRVLRRRRLHACMRPTALYRWGRWGRDVGVGGRRVGGGVADRFGGGGGGGTRLRTPDNHWGVLMPMPFVTRNLATAEKL